MAADSPDISDFQKEQMAAKERYRTNMAKLVREVHLNFAQTKHKALRPDLFPSDAKIYDSVIRDKIRTLNELGKITATVKFRNKVGIPDELNGHFRNAAAQIARPNSIIGIGTFSVNGQGFYDFLSVVNDLYDGWFKRESLATDVLIYDDEEYDENHIYEWSE
jgi:predicted nucleotide-binding protein